MLKGQRLLAGRRIRLHQGPVRDLPQRIECDQAFAHSNGFGPRQVRGQPAVGAVFCEPRSGLNSLLTGKLTGNFAIQLANPKK